MLDNRTTIVKEIAHDNEEITAFLIEQFTIIFNSPSFEEIIISQVHPLILEDRLPLIIEKIENIITN